MAEEFQGFVASSKYIKLVSSDNKIFYVNKDVCKISKHLTQAIEAPMKESTDENNEQKGDGIQLEVTSDILEICIKFMHYKTVNRKVSFDKPPFPIEPHQALDVLKAAIYL